eukprot:8633558-Pyramimonas_sp.AAC.1
MPVCLTPPIRSCSTSLVLFNPAVVSVCSTVLPVLVLLALAPLSSRLLAPLSPLLPPLRLSAAPSRRPGLPTHWMVCPLDGFAVPR